MSDTRAQSPSPQEIEQKAALNAETGRLSWQELQRHFARGVVVVVSPELDLVDVAYHFVRDEQLVVADWMQQGQLARASEHDAQTWHETNAQFWAIVAAPWVLVQLIQDE